MPLARLKIRTIAAFVLAVTAAASPSWAGAGAASAIGKTRADACANARESATKIYGRDKIKSFGACQCSRQGADKGTWFECTVKISTID